MSSTLETRERAPADSIWRNRPFMLLWSAQAISQTGQNAIWFALMVLIEETTRSTTQLGIAIVSFILPSVIFTVPAGVVVDRVDKRLVLVATNWVRAIAVLGYIFFSQTLTLLYAVTFTFSVVSQFFLPAEAAMIPALVGRRKLITANSLFNLTFTLSQLVGIVFMAPILIKFFGVAALFWIISGLFVLCGLLVFPLPSGRIGEAHPGGNGLGAVRRFASDLQEAWRFLANDRAATLAMVLLTSGATLSLITAMLAPRYMVSIVGIRADDTVYVLAPAGVGMALAALIIGRLSRWIPKELLIVGGAVVTGVGLVLLAVVAPAWTFIYRMVLMAATSPDNIPDVVSLVSLVMVVAAFVGFAISTVIISSQTILQERAPAESRGRVFAVQITLGNLASILPLVFVGGLADLFGVSWVLAALGLGLFGLAYVAWRFYRARILEPGAEGAIPR